MNLLDVSIQDLLAQPKVCPFNGQKKEEKILGIDYTIWPLKHPQYVNILYLF